MIFLEWLQSAFLAPILLTLAAFLLLSRELKLKDSFKEKQMEWEQNLHNRLREEEKKKPE